MKPIFTYSNTVFCLIDLGSTKLSQRDVTFWKYMVHHITKQAMQLDKAISVCLLQLLLWNNWNCHVMVIWLIIDCNRDTAFNDKLQCKFISVTHFFYTGAVCGRPYLLTHMSNKIWYHLVYHLVTTAKTLILIPFHSGQIKPTHLKTGSRPWL